MEVATSNPGARTALLVAVGFVFVSVALSLAFLHDEPERGTFGDMFGGVNALFSGLAFAGLIYTAILQRQELELQRRELAATRDEIRGQRDLLQLQVFETTFFQLLRVFNDIVISIDLRAENGRETRGRDCFKPFFGRLTREYAKIATVASSQTDIDDELAKCDRAYVAFYSDNDANVGHYFRTLYNLVKFVHRHAPKDHRLYTNMIRAQLSSYEVLLLFYNSASRFGQEKFAPLIETYSLLKMLPRDRLLRQSHLKFFAQNAYS